MQILAQLIVSGIAVGMIYGVIAFGYQLTFATSQDAEFRPGRGADAGRAGRARRCSIYVGYWAMLPVVLAFGLLQGARGRAARACARRSRSSPRAGWIMATIALGIIFRNLAENIWGRDALKFPSPLPETPLDFGGVRVLPMEIAIVVGAHRC